MTTMLSEIWSDVRYRMRALFDRDALERELDAELHFHIEREAERHEAAGLSRDEALRRARADFGCMDIVKEASRRARGTAALESLLHDLRAAARRRVRREPGSRAPHIRLTLLKRWAPSVTAKAPSPGPAPVMAEPHLVTPWSHIMEKPVSLLENPRAAGVACAVAATALGLVYMAAAGAPPLYLAVNGLALLMGLAFFALLRPSAGEAPAMHGGVMVAFGGALLATALLGVSVEGAVRWLQVGGLSLQISLILLPPMLVAFARRRNLLSTLGVMLAAVALALQPDRAMAGVLASALAVLAMRRRDPWVTSALGVAVAGFAATLIRPDTLPAVPYVDRILYTAFDVHAMVGLAVVGGALLLAVPALAGRKLDPRNGDVCAVFGIAWLGMVLAAGLGNYPTPLVGYGGSAVLGYVLSLAFLPGKVQSTAAATGRARDADPTENGTRFDLQIAIA